MLINTDTVNKIYAALSDEQSKKVFLKRLNYSMTGDSVALVELVRTAFPDFIDKVLSFTDKGDKIAVYGAGNIPWYPGRALSDLFSSSMIGLFDRNFEKLGTVTSGTGQRYEVQDPELLKRYSKEIVVLIGTPNVKYQCEILACLVQRYGIPAHKILFTPQLQACIEEMYSLYPFFKYHEDEVFVDCGCLDGESSLQFIESINNIRASGDGIPCVAKIFAFEPYENFYKDCCEKLSHVPGATVINKGVWDKEETLRFVVNDLSGWISEKGDVVINTCTLDEELAGEKVTFIKMDIEGAEMNALKGAEKLIRANRPKLAICLYHKAEDILTIPEFILNLDLGYKLYIRHQAMNKYQTILYASPE